MQIPPRTCRIISRRSVRRARGFVLTGNPEVIWCDPVNICESLGLVLLLSFRGRGQQQPWQV
jgi:hypothetical protein